jgi:hypothetical protein
MAYARRYIDVTFSGGSGPVTFNARGKYALRTSARIQHAGGANIGAMQLELRGLSLDHIRHLSTFGTRYNPDLNFQVTVNAGDDINGMITVFSGGIKQAWADMKAMPDVPFYVVASMGGLAQTLPSPPTSFEGTTQVSTILEQLAQKAKLKWEDNGIRCAINDPYFWGSPWKQIKEVIDAARINGVIDNGTLAAWPRSGHRGGDSLFISPKTGLRDYPSFTQYGVQVRTEFHRAITYGGQMTIQSDIKEACGDWSIIRIDYDLQANTPGGSWYAILDGSQIGAPVTNR